MRKLNISNEKDARERIRRGIAEMNALVSKTYGPRGQSVIIERGAGEPLIVDDGRRVAENIKLDDPIGQMAVRACYSVTRKTDEKAGDGTTTAMILTNAGVDEVAKSWIVPGAIGGPGVDEVDTAIHASCKNVVAKLREMAKPIETQQELIEVATVSSGDARLGEIIGKTYWQLGKDGHISLEFNLVSEEIETEVRPGYRFSGGYAASWMVTDAIRRMFISDDAPVLICDFSRDKDIVWDEVIPYIQLAFGDGSKNLVIIAKRFTKTFLEMAHAQAFMKQGSFNVICVRAPSRGEEAYKDMAIYTGAKLFTDKDDLKTDVSKDNLGKAKRIELSDDTCILIEGAGKREDVVRRAEEAKAEAEQQKVPPLKQDRLERASALLGGVGVIKIGAPTDEERNWLKHKIEDAKWATKHAFRHGIVPGAGQTFKTISESLDDKDILKNVLMAPYDTLKKNGGGVAPSAAGIFDPVFVEITALEVACSAISKLTRIGGAIATAPKPQLEEAFKAIIKTNNDDGVEEDTDE